MKRLLKPKRGSALLFTIFASTIIMFIAVILLNYYMNEIRIKNASEERIQCKYIAEAGIEHGIGEINKILTENLILDSAKIQSLMENTEWFKKNITIEGNTTLGASNNINGNYDIKFYDSNNSDISQIAFHAINTVPASSKLYEVNLISPLEFNIISTGNLKSSSGKVLKTTIMDARVKFEVDYAQKKVIKVSIIDWKEKQ